MSNKIVGSWFLSLHSANGSIHFPKEISMVLEYNPRMSPITTGVDKTTGRAKHSFCARILQAALANLKHITLDKMFAIEIIKGK